MFSAFNVSSGLTSIFIEIVEFSLDASAEVASKIRKSTVVTVSLTTFIYFGFNFFMQLVLS